MSSAADNMRQAASDLLGVKGAIIEKGVEIPYGTPTSEYADKIREIESGATLNYTFDIESGVLKKGEISVNGELTLTIPDGVTEIGEGAFANNFANNAGIKLATALNIPNSVTYIGDSAFNGCNFLNELTIPNSVTIIRDNAFWNCNSLKELTISDSVISIGSGAFGGCNSLTELTISNSVTGIGGSAFLRCYSLEKLTIPKSVTDIGQYAFDGCKALTELTIPKSVTDIGQYAFRGCNSLTDIYYSGTEEEWNAITGLANAGFKGTETIHYNYTGDGSEL